MDLSDKYSKDVIKIFHNAKGSIFNDVLKLTRDLHDSNYKTLHVNEHATSNAVYSAKKYNKVENPSVFGEQPVSEYAQQPYSPRDNNRGKKPKDEEKKSSLEIAQQGLTKEDLRRNKEIEQQDSDFKGPICQQR